MFVKLAFRNMKRSLKDYAIYFFTLLLGVAIFYVFNALGTQTIMLSVSERVKMILELLDVLMGVVSVFISFILGALIIYAARFLMKRRSKEFGVYMLLGMSKRKISLILLIETFLIGLLSLSVGLILGILASQLVSVLVANMFDANLTEYHFVFSLPALLKTLLYFGIIYLVVIFFNTIAISRQKLINLLSSSKRNEKIKLKNLWLCTVIFIVAAVMLGVAYYLVTSGLTSFISDAENPQILLIPIVMGVAATFLLFWSLSGILLRIFISLKNIYYQKLNSFVLRQFSSQINTTVASMSLICLMLFVTILVLCSASSISSNLHTQIEKSLPMDAQIVRMGSGAPSILDGYREDGTDLTKYLRDIEVYETYFLKDVMISDTLGEEVLGDASSERDLAMADNYNSTVETFVHSGDYNRVAKWFELPKVELEKDEYAVLANFSPVLEIRNKALALGKNITIAGRTLKPKYAECIYGSIELEMSNLNAGLIIVPDDVDLAKDSSSTREVLLANYANPEEAEIIDRKLYSISNLLHSVKEDDGTSHSVYYYSASTRQDIIDNNVGTSALVTFVGLYIGIIFLISSAAVLALKQLSESSDNRDKYTVLRKIGASNELLNRALFWQIFIFFVFPLAIAVLHSVFGLMFCDFVLSTLGGLNIMHALPYVGALLLVIYGGYFGITYYCSRNMIREQRQ